MVINMILILIINLVFLTLYKHFLKQSMLQNLITIGGVLMVVN